MEEEPEDTLNEGVSSEGVWFVPCVCACISCCLDSSSIDKGTRQQTGFEGLKEVQRWRCLNGSKGGCVGGLPNLATLYELTLGVYQQGYDPWRVWVWVGPWHPGVYPCPSLFIYGYPEITVPLTRLTQKDILWDFPTISPPCQLPPSTAFPVLPPTHLLCPQPS